MGKIDLNAQETEWAITLGNFKISLDEDYNTRISKLEIADLLARSLLARDAIPKIRFKYFTDPRYNLSNPRKSHEDIFGMHGVEGEAILSDPSFLKYLKYFIYGADLPESLKTDLASLKESHHYDDDFIDSVVPILKAHLRTLGNENRTEFAEEVFKQCLDLEVELVYAVPLRNKVMSWRR